MTFLGGLFLKLSLLGIAIGGVFVCKKCLRLKDDNIIEETIEQVIKDQTGVDIDLTPSTPEDHSQPVSPIQEEVAKDISELLDSVKDVV